MSKFLNIFKTVFVKVWPTFVKVEPVIVSVAEGIDPKLIPVIETSQAAVNAFKGIRN